MNLSFLFMEEGYNHSLWFFEPICIPFCYWSRINDKMVPENIFSIKSLAFSIIIIIFALFFKNGLSLIKKILTYCNNNVLWRIITIEEIC